MSFLYTKECKPQSIRKYIKKQALSYLHIDLKRLGKKETPIPEVEQILVEIDEASAIYKRKLYLTFFTTYYIVFVVKSQIYHSLFNV